MRALSAFAAALVACTTSSSCSSESLLPDTGGPDAGPFAVSGTVKPFPLATRWYAEQGKSSPSRAGLSLRLEDPYVTAHLPDDGLDLASSIDEDGRFSFVDIAGRVSVGMAALLTDPRPTRLSLPSETFLFEGGPQTVSDAAAYMLPADFAAALAAATSIADLAQRGFLLGVVLDAGGHPVSGATIEGYGLEPSRLLYLGEDLVPVAGGVATGTSGAFLVAGPLELMNFTVEGLEGYPRRKGLVRPGLAFLIVFQP